MKLTEACNDPPGMPCFGLPLSFFLHLLALALASNQGLVSHSYVIICSTPTWRYPQFICSQTIDYLFIHSFSGFPHSFPSHDSWFCLTRQEPGIPPRCFFTGLARVLDYCGVGPNTSPRLLWECQQLLASISPQPIKNGWYLSIVILPLQPPPIFTSLWKSLT